MASKSSNRLWGRKSEWKERRKKVFVRVPETILVYDIVRPYIEECQDKLGEESPFFLYQVEGFGGLDFKLKSEGVQVGRGAVHRRRRRYHNIDISKSLIRNLEGRINHQRTPIETMHTPHHLLSTIRSRGRSSQNKTQTWSETRMSSQRSASAWLTSI